MDAVFGLVGLSLTYSVVSFLCQHCVLKHERLVDCTERTLSFCMYIVHWANGFLSLSPVYKQHKISVVLRSEENGWIGLHIDPACDISNLSMPPLLTFRCAPSRGETDGVSPVIQPYPVLCPSEIRPYHTTLLISDPTPTLSTS